MNADDFNQIGTRASRRGPRRGFALLLVLMVVSFAAVVALMFLLSARQEHAGTTGYVEGSAVRELGSQAVNVVIGQINAATHEGTMAVPVSWASQPGMIRTYNSQGDLSNAYKLYSWNNLTETGANFQPGNASELPASNWTSEPSAYTDINQPVNSVYPIVDPSVLDTASTNTSFSGVTNPNGIRWDFPGEAGLLTQSAGYYPSSTNTAPMPVQWLYVLQDGTWSAPTNVSGNTVTVPNASATNPIVGRIAFWTDDETAKVNVNTAGEGAYWDTPKAGTTDELQFAGNPPLQSEYFRLPGHPATTSLSAIFPELLGGATSFSRWLSSGGVNGAYLTAMQSIFGYGVAGTATDHGLNPRISWGSSTSSGGSQGGTYPITSYLATYAPQVSSFFSGGYVAPSTYAPTPNTDRLFATTDDLYFQPGQPGGTSRSDNVAFTNYGITAKALSQRLFFLTANSKAPETTLYDTPRVSLWPITWPYANASYYVDGARSTPAAQPTLTPSPANLSSNPFMAYQEKLLAFCSTLNAGSSTASTIDPYYFQRQDPDSPTYDWTNITRNQNLVNYLTEELSDPSSAKAYPTAPGMGASLGSKWDGDKSGTTDWIVTNCFDYVRSMINQYTLDPTPGNAGKLLYGYTGVNFAPSYSEPNSFSVAPLHVTVNGHALATQGTYPALREAAVVFYATARNVPTLKPAFLGNPVTKTKLSDVVDPANWNNLMTWDPTSKTGNTQTTKMRMVMLLNFSEMNPGIVSNAASTNGVATGTTYGVYHPVFWVRVSTPTGSSPFKVNGSSINFPLSGGNVVQFNPINTAPLATAPNWESSLFQSATATTSTAKVFSNSATGANAWTLVSDEITLPGTGGQETFTFTGSKVQFDIYAIDPSGNINVDPTGSAANLVYSYQMDFSQWNSTTSFKNVSSVPGSFPVPVAPYWNTRQGQMMVVTPPSTTPVPATDPMEASPPATTTVSGGVLMPYNQNVGTTIGLTGDKNWQAEIMTRLALLTNIRTPPQYNFPWGNRSAFGNVPTIMDPADQNYFTPLMYIFQDNLWDGSSVAHTTATGSNYSSTIFEDRVRALTLNTASGSTARGQLIDNATSPGYGFSVVWHPLNGNYGPNLFSDATTQYSDAMEGYGLVTPFDTAFSMVAEPRSAKSPAAGDPRLTGRGISSAGGTGSVIFAPLSAEQICASIPTTDALNTDVNPFTGSNSTVYTPTNGLSTYGAQYCELDSTGPIPSVTGIKPQWQFVGPSETMNTGSPMDVKGGVTLTSFYPNTSTNGAGYPSNGLLMGYNDPSGGLGLDANVLMSILPNMDWTRQPGSFPDGGYVVRPDQEYQSLVPKTSGAPLALTVPFFNDGGTIPVSYNGATNVSTGFFSPNRQVPSPVILGTLPDSAVTGWQTLNFCPNPAVAMNQGVMHPGLGIANTPSAGGPAYATAPDHLLLDLFWMPVAEPYPISEEFATAGKVNLNYAMMPFPYIQRKTALDALLKSVWITAMPDPTITPTEPGNTNNFPPFPQNYKSYGLLYQLNREDLTHTRFPINVDATLRAFDYKFQQGDIFRSASQVCDMFLYPNDPTTPNTLWAGNNLSKGISGPDVAPSTANITAWWKANSFTADNEREAPYNAIYSRVTTKSNTYTVHWKVQTLKKTPGDPTHWTEGTDVVTAELRGSSLIERYIDPGTPLPDYATNTAARAGDTVQPMSYYYKWRVDSENYFRPSP